MKTTEKTKEVSVAVRNVENNWFKASLPRPLPSAIPLSHSSSLLKHTPAHFLDQVPLRQRPGPPARSAASSKRLLVTSLVQDSSSVAWRSNRGYTGQGKEVVCQERPRKEGQCWCEENERQDRGLGTEQGHEIQWPSQNAQSRGKEWLLHSEGKD